MMGIIKKLSTDSKFIYFYYLVILSTVVFCLTNLNNRTIVLGVTP